MKFFPPLTGGFSNLLARVVPDSPSQGVRGESGESGDSGKSNDRKNCGCCLPSRNDDPLGQLDLDEILQVHLLNLTFVTFSDPVV